MYHINSCNHYNVLEDLHEGTNVCTDCGFVVEDVIFGNPPPISAPTPLSTDTTYLQVKNVIENIFETFNIPKKYLSEIINKYLLYNLKSINYIKICKEIYASNVKHVMGVSLKQLQQYCNTKFNFTSVKNLKNSSVLVVKPSDILNKMCLSMNINSNSILSELNSNKMQNLLRNNHFNPKTIIAGLIYQYSKENKKGFTMKYISKYADVSVMSIQRFNKLNKK